MKKWNLQDFSIFKNALKLWNIVKNNIIEDYSILLSNI